MRKQVHINFFQEDLTHEVELQKDVIAQLKKALNTSRSEIEEECERCYQEGYDYGRHLATVEELGKYTREKIFFVLQDQ